VRGGGRRGGLSCGRDAFIEGTIAIDTDHLPAGVRGGELVVVAQNLMGKRSLKRQ
jgi:hypothetical protein